MVTPTAMEVFGMAYGIALLIWQAIACWYMIVDGNDFAVASMLHDLSRLFLQPRQLVQLQRVDLREGLMEHMGHPGARHTQVQSWDKKPVYASCRRR